MNELIRIEPPPYWEEEPWRDKNGNWCSHWRWAKHQYGITEMVELDERVAPNGFYPIEINGVWFWIWMKHFNIALLL